MSVTDNTNDVKRETPLVIERKGEKLVIPENMTLKQTKEWVERAMTEEEKVVAINEGVDAYPLDAAHALMLAMQEKFGWASAIPTPGFFGDRPPAMLGIEVDHGTVVQVPWARFNLPGVEGWIAPQVRMKEGQLVFGLVGEVKSKHKAIVADLARLTRNIVRERSIYKGKAIRVDMRELDPNDPSSWDPTAHAPHFLDLRDVKEGELILPSETKRLVETNLFTPIEQTQECRDLRIPLKRGILMAGTYGVGKTLTAKVTAKKAVEHKWTFVLLKNVSQLSAALGFARQYQPCVVFTEDIDQVMGTDERTEEVNEILNTIDGVELKGAEVIVCLSTNHPEKVSKAMLRPGRLDAVIPLPAPDANAVGQLIQLFARNLLAPGSDLGPIGKKLAGQIPAVIREVVERAKLAAVRRTRGQAFDPYLTADDLDVSADSMLAHFRLMAGPRVEVQDPFQVLGNAVGERIGASLEKLALQAGQNRQATDVATGRELPAPSTEQRA